MVRHLLASFFLSFFAALVLICLYVFLPQFLASRFGGQIRQILPVAAPVASPTPTPTPTPSPTPALTPATLIIPKLNIQAAVEPVGVTETENMDVPKNDADAAWYMYGSKPSEEGNAVIAGHYDTPTGKPALFYNLNKLVEGDEVIVISSNAVKNTFVVTGKDRIPYDEFPSDYVFTTKEGKNVNLITCGGIWDQKTRNYQDRYVVYTTLVEDNTEVIN